MSTVCILLLFQSKHALVFYRFKVPVQKEEYRYFFCWLRFQMQNKVN